MRRLFFITVILLFCAMGYSQDPDSLRSDTVHTVMHFLKTATFDGQTYPLVELKEVIVTARVPRSASLDYRKHARLIYNVRRVYPYAIIVRNELGRVNRLLETMPGERDQRNFMQQYEKDIFNTYEDDMRKLTFTQGKILIKLIDRETENTSYDLIKKYRGNFSAVFWQSIARIFGNNLKSDYDPNGVDYEIEQVVREIEAGRL